MAKKRTKGAVRRTLPQSSYHLRSLRIADTLVIIAIAFTLINAILILAFPDSAVTQSLNKYGSVTDRATWQLLGVAWIFLSLFAYIANRITKVIMHKPTMWGLLLIGILLGFASWGFPPLVSALLIVVSALIYISKSRK